MGEGSSGKKGCPAQCLFPYDACQASLDLIQAVTTAGPIHPNTIRKTCWGAMVKRGRTRGAGELKVLGKIGDISPWLQGIRMLRGEDSLGFEVSESPQLDA